MNNNAYYWTKFKIYRNKIKHLLLISKKSHYNNYFANNRNNIKETWKGIKQLITLKPTKNSFPTTLEVGSSQLSNSQVIANAFNNYFSTVGSNLVNSIPIVQTPIETFLNAPLSIALNSLLHLVLKLKSTS